MKKNQNKTTFNAFHYLKRDRKLTKNLSGYE